MARPEVLSFWVFKETASRICEPTPKLIRVCYQCFMSPVALYL